MSITKKLLRLGFSEVEELFNFLSVRGINYGEITPKIFRKTEHPQKNQTSISNIRRKSFIIRKHLSHAFRNILRSCSFSPPNNIGAFLIFSHRKPRKRGICRPLFVNNQTNFFPVSNSYASLYLPMVLSIISRGKLSEGCVFR